MSTVPVSVESESEDHHAILTFILTSYSFYVSKELWGGGGALPSATLQEAVGQAGEEGFCKNLANFLVQPLSAGSPTML